MAAIFPIKLCKAILSGLKQQLRKDGVVLNGTVGLHERCNGNYNDNGNDNDNDNDNYYECDGHILKFDSGEGPFFDDLTQQELPRLLVKAARRKELDYFESKSVWRRVPLARRSRFGGWT